MIDFVVDASALIELAVSPQPNTALYRRVRAGTGAAPEILDVEALHVLRRLERGGLAPQVVEGAVRDVRSTAIARMSHRPLLDRVWELRHTVSAYDACYVALAERLSVPLLTCDARLGRAHGHDAEVIAYARG